MRLESTLPAVTFSALRAAVRLLFRVNALVFLKAALPPEAPPTL